MRVKPIVQVNPLTLEHRTRVVELAARFRLPAIYEIRGFADDGGLVAYGPDLNAMCRRAASYVDRVCKGARAGDLAIEQPSKLELVFNLKTAKGLGLSIPPSDVDPRCSANDTQRRSNESPPPWSCR